MTWNYDLVVQPGNRILLRVNAPAGSNGTLAINEIGDGIFSIVVVIGETAAIHAPSPPIDPPSPPNHPPRSNGRRCIVPSSFSFSSSSSSSSWSSPPINIRRSSRRRPNGRDSQANPGPTVPPPVVINLANGDSSSSPSQAWVCDYSRLLFTTLRSMQRHDSRFTSRGIHGTGSNAQATAEQLVTYRWATPGAPRNG